MTFFGLEVRRPQVFGGLLLLALAVGALMTSRKTPLSPDELQLLSRSVEITAPIKPELRKDPIVGRWVIIATDRAKRPVAPRVEPEAPGGTLCPFCEGQEDKTPFEIIAYRDRNIWVMAGRRPMVGFTPALQ